jgi:LysM repeat protein
MPNFLIHTVEAGDTLTDIAALHGVSTASLVRLNGLRDPDQLAVGQRLRVPMAENRPPMNDNRPPRPENRPPMGGNRPPREEIYVVEAGDTLGEIAFRYGTTVPVLVRLNGLEDPDVLFVGQELRVPRGATRPGEWYEVQPGDTLFAIAAEYGTTVEALIRLNNITTPNLIYPGERLRLPMSDRT